MSRAFESSLANQLARLDQWINESESLASRSEDEETLQRVEDDIARWQVLRDQCAQALTRTKWMNRLALWMQATFWISFVVLLGITFVGIAVVETEGVFLPLLVAVDLLVLVGTGVAYVMAIIIRDVVAQSHQPWRFSLRSLLVGTTVIAVLLALLAFALGK